mmetsp:Transcript_6752/g.21779  ORF Transcript_6752/g.21779 Transcript_6752/m.21779 type:complete len:321 (-) Transcript_6752:181-1143(-)
MRCSRGNAAPSESISDQSSRPQPLRPSASTVPKTSGVSEAPGAAAKVAARRPTFSEAWSSTSPGHDCSSVTTLASSRPVFATSKNSSAWPGQSTAAAPRSSLAATWSMRSRGCSARTSAETSAQSRRPTSLATSLCRCAPKPPIVLRSPKGPRRLPETSKDSSAGSASASLVTTSQSPSKLHWTSTWTSLSRCKSGCWTGPTEAMPAQRSITVETWQRSSCCRARVLSSPTSSMRFVAPRFVFARPCVSMLPGASRGASMATYFARRAAAKEEPTSSFAGLTKLAAVGNAVVKYRVSNPRLSTTEPSPLPRAASSHSTPT